MLDKIILREEEKSDYFENENLTREAFWNVYKPGCDEHFIQNKLRERKSFIKELTYVATFEESVNKYTITWKRYYFYIKR